MSASRLDGGPEKLQARDRLLQGIGRASLNKINFYMVRVFE